MFTGIVSDVGIVSEIMSLVAGVRFRIATGYASDTIAIGASIACSGPCLTVVQLAAGESGSRFDVDVSSETLARTTLGSWKVGDGVNLERSLRLGDELGGHMVTGHVDGAATILSREAEGGMARFRLEAPRALARFIAEKGSVCLDGTSLTVNQVDEARFDVMIIPHTLAVTTWGVRCAGDKVNLEVDLFARYLDRLQSPS